MDTLSHDWEDAVRSSPDPLHKQEKKRVETASTHAITIISSLPVCLHLKNISSRRGKERKPSEKNDFFAC